MLVGYGSTEDYSHVFTQIYTEHIERLLLQAHKRLEAFEQSWAAKQHQLEKVVDGPDSTRQPAPELEKVWF